MIILCPLPRPGHRNSKLQRAIITDVLLCWWFGSIHCKSGTMSWYKIHKLCGWELMVFTKKNKTRIQ